MRRSGTLAWAGYAAVRYEQVTGDDRFRPLATGIADYLVTLQVASWNGHAPSDPRYGSVLGGPDVDWASTEHNIDAYFFLRDLGRLPGASGYRAMANMVGDSLWGHHWDSWRERFFQGVTTSWPDPTRALDLSSWGGLFWLAHGRADLAAQARVSLDEFRVEGAAVTRSTDPNSYNTTFAGAGPLRRLQALPARSGRRERRRTSSGARAAGAPCCCASGSARTSPPTSPRCARCRRSTPAGGYLQVSQGYRPPPFEYHAWPSVAGTAWAVMVLRDDGSFWAERLTGVVKIR